MHTNAVLVTSDRIKTKTGSLSIFSHNSTRSDYVNGPSIYCYLSSSNRVFNRAHYMSDEYIACCSLNRRHVFRI